jgi:hypothetical protein
MKTYPSIFETLLRPMEALAAAAVVATAILALAGQSAHSQEAHAIASSKPLPPKSTSPAVPWELISSASIPSIAAGSARTASDSRLGVYFSHVKDLTLDGGGPNGPNTREWRYTLVLHANGVSEFIAQIIYSYYPGFGANNFIQYNYYVWGPNQTAIWSTDGSHLRVTGAGFQGQQDTGNPSRNFQSPFPPETITFNYRWLPPNFTTLQLTGMSFNLGEGNVWNFHKIAN